MGYGRQWVVWVIVIPSCAEKTQEEVESLGVATARVTYSATRGYHLSIASANPAKTELPAQFINVVRNRGCITATTRSLVRFNGT